MSPSPRIRLLLLLFRGIVSAAKRSTSEIQFTHGEHRDFVSLLPTFPAPSIILATLSSRFLSDNFWKYFSNSNSYALIRTAVCFSFERSSLRRVHSSKLVQRCRKVLNISTPPNRRDQVSVVEVNSTPIVDASERAHVRDSISPRCEGFCSF